MKHDKIINVAIGRSRKELNYVNLSLSYSEFIDKYIKNTIYTNETYKEYINFPKDIQDNIKDVGGFVGGTLKDGKRRKDTIINRSLITLDVDFGYKGMIEDIEKNIDFGMCIYTTHKHTEINPRFRIIIPLKENVDTTQYEAIARKIAFDIGIDYFDDTTYSPSRLMYFPSTSKDGEFVFKLIDKDWLNPKDILSKYSDYKNENLWPFSSKTKPKYNNLNNNNKENPMLKDNIIGAFCRVYNVYDVMDKFLYDVYKKGDSEDRYTYINGSTSNGVVIYENGNFAYSHHSSDVCCDKLCNSFDLVRLHKFSHLDINISKDTPINKLPSYIKMIEFISKDEKVMLEFGQRKLKNAIKDFSSGFDEDVNIKCDDSWTLKLELDKNGLYKSSNKNIVTILDNDKNLKGKIAYNLFSNRTIIKGDLPWKKVIDKENGDPWQDSDDANLRMYMEVVYKIVSPYKIYDGVSIIEKRNEYHPVRDYLNSLKWDNVSRVDNLMIDYLGADNSDYTKAITRKMLVAAVTRIFKPGTKFDNMMVLVGKQGIGKSYLISLLGKHWYSDSLNTVQGKEAYEQLQNAWILEMAELSATKKAEAESVKHFISKTEDSYRQAYGRRVETFKRQCVFFGTTNDIEFLKDRTGNRRYWPLMVGVNKSTKNLFEDLNKYEIDMIWAEAMHFYKNGEKLILEGDVQKEAILKQEKHLESNSKEGMIKEYLDIKLPKNWYDMDIYARRRYISESEFLRVDDDYIRREKVCSVEIWVELFGGDIKNFYRANALEINDILRKLEDWESLKDGQGKLRFGKFYGTQRAFLRKA